MADHETAGGPPRFPAEAVGSAVGRYVVLDLSVVPSEGRARLLGELGVPSVAVPEHLEQEVRDLFMPHPEQVPPSAPAVGLHDLANFNNEHDEWSVGEATASWNILYALVHDVEAIRNGAQSAPPGSRIAKSEDARDFVGGLPLFRAALPEDDRSVRPIDLRSLYGTLATFRRGGGYGLRHYNTFSTGRFNFLVDYVNSRLDELNDPTVADGEYLPPLSPLPERLRRR
jgi:hypothetical protein